MATCPSLQCFVLLLFVCYLNLNGGGAGGKVAKETGISKEHEDLKRWRGGKKERKKEGKKCCPKRRGNFRALREDLEETFAMVQL